MLDFLLAGSNAEFLLIFFIFIEIKTNNVCRKLWEGLANFLPLHLLFSPRVHHHFFLCEDQHIITVYIASDHIVINSDNLMAHGRRYQPTCIIGNLDSLPIDGIAEHILIEFFLL